jgi:hypothetical protein
MLKYCLDKRMGAPLTQAFDINSSRLGVLNIKNRLMIENIGKWIYLLDGIPCTL